LAIVRPFRALRYTAKAGDPARLLTEPYDKISPEMRARYLDASPYNLVRVILPESYPQAGQFFGAWIRDGILAQDPEPRFYPYFQEFTLPDSNERLLRKGFIGLGKIEDYRAGVVYRHEQTLTGPKKDRRQVLEHTRAHFGQIFVLYADREGRVESWLDQAARGAPLTDVADEYGTRHRLWAVAEAGRMAALEELMADKKLIIADGHHRYETALGYRDDHPEDESARFVMMTFVDMFSPGLRILPTHRVLRNLESFDQAAFLQRARQEWSVTAFSVDGLMREFGPPHISEVRIGLATAAGAWLLERPRQSGELDVAVLHHDVLGGLLGIGEDAVREQKHIQYVRGLRAAVAEVRERGAQAAFLVEPVRIEDVARAAFGGGVMPQKSTDFYPKLLSGIAIYRLGAPAS
jgi:uncharacterized protein (DUF1015 family)